MRARIIVPCPRRDSICTDPPSSATRSCIPCRPSPDASLKAAAGSNPTPSSWIAISIIAFLCFSMTPTPRAWACRATFVSASCRIRYIVDCASGAIRRGTLPTTRKSTATPNALPKSLACRRAAATSPLSSRTAGCSPRANRPTSSTVCAATSRSRSAIERTSASPVLSPMARRPTNSVVSDCPVSSCSSRAIRRRKQPLQQPKPCGLGVLAVSQVRDDHHTNGVPVSGLERHLRKRDPHRRRRPCFTHEGELTPAIAPYPHECLEAVALGGGRELREPGATYALEGCVRDLR